MTGIFVAETNEVTLRATAPHVAFATMIFRPDGKWRQNGYRSGDLTLFWTGNYKSVKDYQGHGEAVVIEVTEAQPKALVDSVLTKPHVYAVSNGGATISIGNSKYHHTDPTTSLGKNTLLRGVAHSMCGFQRPALSEAAKSVHSQVGRFFFSLRFESNYEAHVAAIHADQGMIELPHYYRIVDGRPVPSTDSLESFDPRIRSLLSSYNPNKEFIVLATFPKDGTSFLFRGDASQLYSCG